MFFCKVAGSFERTEVIRFTARDCIILAIHVDWNQALVGFKIICDGDLIHRHFGMIEIKKVPGYFNNIVDNEVDDERGSVQKGEKKRLIEIFIDEYSLKE